MTRAIFRACARPPPCITMVDVEHMTRESFDSRIEHLVTDYCAMHGSPQSDDVLKEVTAQAATSSRGGKRLRAMLLLETYDAARDESRAEHQTGASDDAAADVACAIEIFQTAALVHDDIIDDSDMRRGLPAAHKALSRAVGSPSMGRGLAIMLGDLLATASVDVAHRASRSFPESRDALMDIFLRMHREVEVGQFMDLAVETISLDDPAALRDSAERTYRWKTASYTTIAPIELGLVCAGADARTAHDAALAIGEPLGVAFQINDDLIDVIGSSKSTGKPVGGDIREGKRTMLLADALDGADESDRRHLVESYASADESGRDVERITGIFKRSGAIAASRSRIDDLWRQSLTALADRAQALGIRDTSSLCAMCARFVPTASADGAVGRPSAR